jgi:hypothetical protein
MTTFGCLLRVAIATAMLSSVANAEPQLVDYQEEAKELVVMLRTKSADGEEGIGAGIIVGADSERFYIATANHVVRVPDTAQSIEVRFRGLEKAVPAELAKDADPSMDLAVLSVAGAKGLGIDVDALPFDRWNDPTALKRGDPVVSLGNPGGNSWYVPVDKEKFSGIDGNRLLYETNFIDPGHSGGALLDDDDTIVGMLLFNKPPVGAALSITRLLARLKEWGCPVRLGKARAAATYEMVSPGPEGFFDTTLPSSVKPQVRDDAGRVKLVDACGLATDGAIYCWGGPGSSVPRRLPGRIRFKTTATGLIYTCGLTADGAAYCMGRNPDGQLGNGSREEYSRSFVPVEGRLAFKSLSAGRNHTCGVTKAGAAYCWGANQAGQLGNGSTDGSAVPVPVSGGLTFASLSCSGNRTCGLTTTGRAYCWGAKDHHNRTVPTPGPDVPPLKALSAGFSETCGLAASGEAYCWTWYDEKEQVIKGDSPFESVAVGGTTYALGDVCALTKKGAAYCWHLSGAKDYVAVPKPVSGGLVFKQLSMADFYTCGVTANGKAYCWGRNDVGQLGNGSTSKKGPLDPVAVSTEP